MSRKTRQKCKYLENKKSFKDEIKIIFHQFYRAFIEANKTSFLEGESALLIDCKCVAKVERN